MGLWLEHRENGQLISSEQFASGTVAVPPTEEGGEPMVLTIEQAQMLARPSNGLPAERREWVLRVR